VDRTGTANDKDRKRTVSARPPEITWSECPCRGESATRTPYVLVGNQFWSDECSIPVVNGRASRYQNPSTSVNGHTGNPVFGEMVSGDEVARARASSERPTYRRCWERARVEFLSATRGHHITSGEFDDAAELLRTCLSVG
jgi:hypothetical protein